MFDTFFYEPIYNLIIFLSNYLDDFGMVIIITTLIIKIILYPLYSGQIKNQIATKKAQPELKEIQEKLKEEKEPFQRQKLVMEMMSVNKKYGVKILMPLVSMVFQMTVLIALYWILYKGGLPKIKLEELYSFVKPNDNIIMNLWGILDLSKPSIIIGVLAGVTQFIHLSVSMPEVKFSDLKAEPNANMKDDMMKSFQVYIKYGLPWMIFFMAGLTFNAGLGLYWVVSNIFMIFQEKSVRSHKEELKSMKEEEKRQKEIELLNEKK